MRYVRHLSVRQYEVLNLLSSLGPMTSDEIAKLLNVDKTKARATLYGLVRLGLVKRAWLTKRRRQTGVKSTDFIMVEGGRQKPIYYVPQHRKRVFKMLTRILKKPMTPGEKKSMLYLIRNSELEPYLEERLKRWAHGEL